MVWALQVKQRWRDATLVTPAGEIQRDLLIEGDRFSAIVERNSTTGDDWRDIDAKGKILFPGMIDLLQHGLDVHLYNDTDPGAVAHSSQLLLARGVTGFLPSISCLPPGGASTFHTHMENYEGPYETFYIVLDGTALIRNEYEDFVFTGGPSGVYVPADASHQIINNGEGLLWYLTLSSRGGVPLKIDVYNMPSGAERPGYLDEYNRIMAARQERGLPLP